MGQAVSGIVLELRCITVGIGLRCEQAAIVSIGDIHLRQGCPQATLTGNAVGLQLKGHWLEQAEFAINSPMTVRVMRGCLVLTAE